MFGMDGCPCNGPLPSGSYAPCFAALLLQSLLEFTPLPAQVLLDSLQTQSG